MKINRNPDVWTPEFQDQLLTAVIQDPQLIASAREVFEPDVFEDEKRGKVLEHVLDFYDQYRKLPSKSTLVDLVKRGTDDADEARDLTKVVKRAFKTPLVDNEFIRDEALYAAKSSACKRALVKSATLLREGKFDDIEGVIRNALMVGQGTFDMGVSLRHDGLKYLREEFSETTRTIDMSYRRLMKAIGGIEVGELATILAPPNVGKTLFLQNIACGAWMRGHNVQHYSFELSERKTVLRYLARAAGIDYKKLAEKADDVRKTLRIVDKVSGKDLRIKFAPAKTMTPKALRSHLLFLKANGFTPDLVVFDYADLIKPPQTRQAKREELSDIYLDLRSLAGELEVFAATATQTVRSALYKAHVDLDSVAEDWGKVQTADIVIAICQTKEEFNRQMYRVFIAKSRGEMRGKQVFFKVNYNKLWMRETSRSWYMGKLPEAVKAKYGFEEFAEEEVDDGKKQRHDVEVVSERSNDL